MFIVISTLIFLFIGKPVSLLIIAGAINGWILPITLGAILIASRKNLLLEIINILLGCLFSES